MTLLATPAQGWKLSGWVDVCATRGTAAVCGFPLVTKIIENGIPGYFTRAVFVKAAKVEKSGSATIPLSIVVAGPGVLNWKVGTVSGTCKQATQCHVDAPITPADLPFGLDASFVAVPQQGAAVDHWQEQGLCRSHGHLTTCSATVTGGEVLSVTFAETTYPLLVKLHGYGSITWSVNGKGAGTCDSNSDCGPFDIPAGSTVKLTETPSAGWLLTGWGAACKDTVGPTCTLKPDQLEVQPLVASAASRVDQPELHINVAGKGAVVTVKQDPGPPATFTFTAKPEPGWKFAGWKGDCSGLGDCMVVVNTIRVIWATFVAAG